MRKNDTILKTLNTENTFYIITKLAIQIPLVTQEKKTLDIQHQKPEDEQE